MPMSDELDIDESQISYKLNYKFVVIVISLYLICSLLFIRLGEYYVSTENIEIGVTRFFMLAALLVIKNMIKVEHMFHDSDFANERR